MQNRRPTCASKRYIAVATTAISVSRFTSSTKIAARRSSREVTWQIAPGNSIRSGRAMREFYGAWFRIKTCARLDATPAGPQRTRKDEPMNAIVIEQVPVAELPAA